MAKHAPGLNRLGLPASATGRCCVCRASLPQRYFYFDPSRSNGLSSRCRECDSNRHRVRRAQREGPPKPKRHWLEDL